MNKPQPNQAESARMESELQKELKLLPERKRRTFMIYLQQQEKSMNEIPYQKISYASEIALDLSTWLLIIVCIGENFMNTTKETYG